MTACACETDPDGPRAFVSRLPSTSITLELSEHKAGLHFLTPWQVATFEASFNGEPQEAYSLGGATGEEVVYIVY